MISEQVASEQSRRATCRRYYSCCTVLLLFCLLLHYKSVMSEYLGEPTFEWGGPTFERGFSKIHPSPSLSSHSSSSPMGIFLRDDSKLPWQ